MHLRASDHRESRATAGCDTAPAGRKGSAAASELVRELDHRTSDRIDVWLLWRECDGRLFVAVSDERTGDRFTIDVRDGERAFDVFQHPFAYAAWRGIDTRSGTAGVIASAG
jgi:hypothetical protein